MIKILKRLDLYVLIGLSYILFVIWNRLRIRLPREVPFKIEPEILSLLCKTLPIILTIILLVEIKKKFWPKPSQWKLIQNMQNLSLRLINYWKIILDKIESKSASFVYDFQLGQTKWITEKMFYLFNYLIYGEKKIPLGLKYDLKDTADSIRFRIVEKISKIIVLLPPLLVYNIGLIEVYAVKEISEFYRMLPILLIPAMWKMYLYTLNEYCKLVIKPESNKGVEIKIHIGEPEYESGLRKDIEFVIVDPKIKELNSEKDQHEMECYFRHCYYVYIITQYYRERNQEILSKYKLIILILRILLLTGFLYGVYL